MLIGVLEHERESPAALFADWALARGHALELLDVPAVDAAGAWPPIGAHDALVSLGSDCSVHASPDPWIASELAFLRDAHAAGVPLLGICFGAQALAAALGGEVRRAPHVVASWRRIATWDPSLVPPGPWLRWHADTFSTPPDAIELAAAEAGSLAFVERASVGLQYHPEADAALAAAWIDGARERMVAEGVDALRLRRQVDAAAPAARRRAFDQFDRIARLWGFSPPAPRPVRASPAG